MRITSKHQQYVDLIQITDCHLEHDSLTTLASVNTNDSFLAVLDQVASETADAIFATGDIASGGSHEAYQRFITATNNLSSPVLWLPGNHDEPAIMSAHKPLIFEAEFNNWLVIQLDSKQQGQVGGRLGGEQLQRLQNTIAETEAEFILLFIHHHTLDIGCQWIDRQKLEDGASFWSVIDHPKVKAVICGHVHQASDIIHQGVRVISTPSTCIQFKANSDDFALIDLAPGYRRIRLHHTGQIETGVVRLDGNRFAADLNSSGY
ncbi:3',5'-cyclic adenosine monophosphate phosphodiesterase CpdA [Sinobacterium norvegicum]|uniref:3',5'-cyclic adenosine monophosphate phosphodiesterase CpdA n=1 Tax=Sinobacterium norvegicum TaxID=1641715 RepID=A0ABM9AHW5_9GAMM|nr:3',5'-cyclic-AMP phosphodiesterase [Sinobacterium norvegicum]CAH0992821.1 3',5'-cyclic adenosine monophosphate phosphodiesterase CpdA [Sinobacterium norvegicum]